MVRQYYGREVLMMEYYFFELSKIEKYLDKKIYLYPAGAYSRAILQTCSIVGINISGVIDREHKKIEKFQTIMPSEILQDEDCVIFITSYKYEKELKDELLRNNFLGIVEDFFEVVPQHANECSQVMIERMDLVLTTKCTLRCEKCANLMQYYENPMDVDLDVIKQSITNLLHAVDGIKTVYVLGGEPFIYKDLGEVVSFLRDQKKIDYIVIITNGTLCPCDDEMWRKLHANNVKIHITDYGMLSKKKDDIIGKCMKYRVDCDIEEDRVFYDTGSMRRRNRSEKQLNEVFKNCSTQCRSLFNGKLHYCPRSSHGVDLGLIPKRTHDYVDLLDSSCENIRDQIKTFLERDSYVEACDFCDIRTPGYYEHEYPAAEQTKYVLKV